MDTEKTGDPDNAVLAAALAAQKEDLGMSFETLAERTGLGLRTVKRYIHDERVMNIATVRKMTAALELPFGKFMRDHVTGGE
ncbi:MAG TPA: helix-turn-helix transcriptional regulator [Galbitalea sp.]|jgi:transcriptional regulator with XRE-family HTH domain